MAKLNITQGTKIISHNMEMVVTGETEKRYIGYILYKSENVGECSIEKSMFKNPHYMEGIEIVNDFGMVEVGDLIQTGTSAVYSIIDGVIDARGYFQVVLMQKPPKDHIYYNNFRNDKVGRISSFHVNHFIHNYITYKK